VKKKREIRAKSSIISPSACACVSLSLQVHYTMGGVAVDPGAEVLDSEGSPIPGLYAAGEILSFFWLLVQIESACMNG
jgi:predicted oxidoreductase